MIECEYIFSASHTCTLKSDKWYNFARIHFDWYPEEKSIKWNIILHMLSFCAHF